MKRKLSFSVLLLGALILVSSTAVYAATYLTYGYPDSTIPIKSYSYNDTWQVPMNASLSNWNDANADVTFSKNSTSTNTITAAQFDYEDYGINYVTYVGEEVTKFRIELNARTISDDADDFAKFVQSVFVHELGHAIWLADNPATTSSSIMKYSRDRNTMTMPQTFDINNVKAKY